MREATLDELMERDYPVVIIPIKHDDDRYYMAYLPDFGWSICSATGDTIEEVLKNLERVKREVLIICKSGGRRIPEEWSEVPEYPLLD